MYRSIRILKQFKTCFSPGLNLLVTSEAEQIWHMLKTIAVILSMKQSLLHCNTKSNFGRIDLPHHKKLLGMLSDIAFAQVYFVTATTTTPAVTGEKQNTEKQEENLLVKRK